MAQPEDPPALILRELQDVLFAVASGQPFQRPWAFRYSELRTKLLESGLREKVPGFLFQCGSIDRFRDFITLYHARRRAVRRSSVQRSSGVGGKSRAGDNHLV
jgi:hypothetical protein